MTFHLGQILSSLFKGEATTKAPESPEGYNFLDRYTNNQLRISLLSEVGFRDGYGIDALTKKSGDYPALEAMKTPLEFDMWKVDNEIQEIMRDYGLNPERFDLGDFKVAGASMGGFISMNNIFESQRNRAHEILLERYPDDNRLKDIIEYREKLFSVRDDIQAVMYGDSRGQKADNTAVPAKSRDAEIVPV